MSEHNNILIINHYFIKIIFAVYFLHSSFMSRFASFLRLEERIVLGQGNSKLAVQQPKTPESSGPPVSQADPGEQPLKQEELVRESGSWWNIFKQPKTPESSDPPVSQADLQEQPLKKEEPVGESWSFWHFFKRPKTPKWIGPNVSQADLREQPLKKEELVRESGSWWNIFKQPKTPESSGPPVSQADPGEQPLKKEEPVGESWSFWHFFKRPKTPKWIGPNVSQADLREQPLKKEELMGASSCWCSKESETPKQCGQYVSRARLIQQRLSNYRPAVPSEAEGVRNSTPITSSEASFLPEDPFSSSSESDASYDDSSVQNALNNSFSDIEEGGIEEEKKEIDGQQSFQTPENDDKNIRNNRFNGEKTVKKYRYDFDDFPPRCKEIGPIFNATDEKKMPRPTFKEPVKQSHKQTEFFANKPNFSLVTKKGEKSSQKASLFHLFDDQEEQLNDEEQQIHSSPLIPKSQLQTVLRTFDGSNQYCVQQRNRFFFSLNEVIASQENGVSIQFCCSTCVVVKEGVGVGWKSYTDLSVVFQDQIIFNKRYSKEGVLFFGQNSRQSQFALEETRCFSDTFFTSFQSQPSQEVTRQAITDQRKIPKLKIDQVAPYTQESIFKLGDGILDLRSTEPSQRSSDSEDDLYDGNDREMKQEEPIQPWERVEEKVTASEQSSEESADEEPDPMNDSPPPDRPKPEKDPLPSDQPDPGPLLYQEKDQKRDQEPIQSWERAKEEMLDEKQPKGNDFSDYKIEKRLKVRRLLRFESLDYSPKDLKQVLKKYHS